MNQGLAKSEEDLVVADVILGAENVAGSAQAAELASAHALQVVAKETESDPPEGSAPADQLVVECPTL